MSSETFCSEINPFNDKYLCYVNGVFLGEFDSWLIADNHARKYVLGNINKPDKECTINKATEQVNRPRMQDREATKAILAYHKGLKS